MRRPTFLEFRTSRLAQSVGLCQSDIPSQAMLVNEAMDMLSIDPLQPEEGWWGTWVKMLFNVQTSLTGTPNIVTPREVARLEEMTVCRHPTKIQNEFFEFLDYTKGLRPAGCNLTNVPAPNGLLSNGCSNLLQTYDRGTTATLGTLLATPQTIQVFPADGRDAGKVIIIQGLDNNGVPVTSTDALTGATISGEIVNLKLPFAQTVNVFTKITGFQKDYTFGPVLIFQNDPVSGATNSLSSMENNETVANYRSYFVNGLPNGCCNQSGGAVQVTAMAKLEFIPVVADPDYLYIPNIPALIRQCESIRFATMDNANAFKMMQAKHQEALSLLFGQLDHYLGKERVAITVPIFGSDRLRPQPI